MNIGDRMRAEIDEVVSRESQDLNADYRRLMEVCNRYIAGDARSVLLNSDHAEGPQLGLAAYTLGVHYWAQDETEQAMHWLQIAARYDVGDAALRLALLYEVRSVGKYPTLEALSAGPSDEPAELSMARYWYQRAAEAGYSNDGKQGSFDLDKPAFDLDTCCATMNELRAREEREQIIADAQVDAEKIVRLARLDVQRIVDCARLEVDALAAERKAISDGIDSLRSTLYGLARTVNRQHQAMRLVRRLVACFKLAWRRKANSLLAPASEVQDVAGYCEQVIHGIGVPEAISRPVLSNMIKAAGSPRPVIDEVDRRPRPRSHIAARFLTAEV